MLSVSGCEREMLAPVHHTASEPATALQQSVNNIRMIR